jgi:tRNA modification GTPase
MAALTDADDTIVALSTPPGVGALGIVRVSGPQAIAVTQTLWRGKPLGNAHGHTLLYGKLVEPTGDVLDEVVLGIYRAPHSYTRQDVVEVSCHGSPYILNRVIELLVAAGVRPAQPGEFTLRAFMGGAMDLSQAEAVADLIAARSAQSQQLAMRQLRGGYSTRLHTLRDRLVNFAALVELELDFSEEDVEFADRAALQQSLQQALAEVEKLAGSFAAGNALKNGIPVAIVGKPNAGKSTLLNRLLNENRAIVSPIPGTTRDVIEDTLHLGGFEFRLMDTAGIRQTTDVIEAEGVKRSLEKTESAVIVLLLFDVNTDLLADVQQYAGTLRLQPDATLVYVANKVDAGGAQPLPGDAIGISALTGAGTEALVHRLVAIAQNLAGQDTVITNQRHAYALHKAADSLHAALAGLTGGRSGELLAIDIRHALHYLGEITGEVTTDEILGTIFSKFCIGK